MTIRHVTGSSKAARQAGIAALGLVLAATAMPLAAQTEPEPDLKEIARTPLRDLGIDPKTIPEALRIAVEDPYETARLTGCNAIVADIAEIDRVLGADYDIAERDEDGGISMGKIGQSAIGGLIPFRGIVREVTGAADNERALQAATAAGLTRRGFLKGLGMGRGCAYPARPKAAATGE